MTVFISAAVPFAAAVVTVIAATFVGGDGDGCAGVSLSFHIIAQFTTTVCSKHDYEFQRMCFHMHIQKLRAFDLLLYSHFGERKIRIFFLLLHKRNIHTQHMNGQRVSRPQSVVSFQTLIQQLIGIFFASVRVQIKKNHQ